MAEKSEQNKTSASSLEEDTPPTRSINEVKINEKEQGEDKFPLKVTTPDEDEVDERAYDVEDPEELLRLRKRIPDLSGNDGVQKRSPKIGDANISINANIVTFDSRLQVNSSDFRLKALNPGENLQKTDDSEFEVLVNPVGNEKETRTLMLSGKPWPEPAEIYEVRVRSRLNNDIPSEKQQYRLVSAAVKDLQAKTKKNSDGQQVIELLWNPPKTPVDKYEIVAQSVDIFHGKKDNFRKTYQVDGTLMMSGSYQIGPDIPSGKIYRFEVVAITSGRRSEAAIYDSVIYDWEKPKSLSVELDSCDPYHVANISWDKTSGIDTFELSISSRGKVIQTQSLTGQNYVFKDGYPGKKYTVQLKCGLMGNFHPEALSEVFQLAPPWPKIVTATGSISDGNPVINLAVQSVDPLPDFYIVKLQEENSSEFVTFRFDSERNELVLHGVKYGQKYLVSVQFSLSSIKQFPSKSTSTTVQIPPGKITKIVKTEKQGMVTVTWKKAATEVNAYIVKWAEGTDKFEEVHLRKPPFQKTTRGIGEDITISIAAKNNGGVGPFSEEKDYSTEPHSPININCSRCDNNPQSCIIVKYDDNCQHPLKEYLITVGSKSVKTDMLQYRMDGLSPGTSYPVSVCSTINGKRSADCIMQNLMSTAKAPILNERGPRWSGGGHDQQDDDGNKEQPVKVKLEDGSYLEYYLRDRIENNCDVFKILRMKANKERVAVVKFVKGVTKRSQREIDNLVQVTRHENVIKCFQYGKCEYEGKEAFFIEMEECENENLWKKLHEKTNLLSIEKRKFYIAGIAKGVECIHENGIVHRDLKPHNILYVHGVPVISDFGWSKQLPSGKSHSQQSVQRLGTNGWRAPETCKMTDTTLTKKSGDIFSLGLIFHFIFTNGKHPYGDDPDTWHANIKNGDNPSLDDLKALVDGPIAFDLIKWMLAKEPENRPTIKQVRMHPFFWDERKRLDFICDVDKYVSMVAEKEKIGAPERRKCSASKFLNDVKGDYAKNAKADKWTEALIFNDKEHRLFKSRVAAAAEQERQESRVDAAAEQESRGDAAAEQEQQESRGDATAEQESHESCGDADQQPEVNAMVKLANGYKQNVSEIVRFIRNRYTHDHESKIKNKIFMTVEELWTFFQRRYRYVLIFVYHKIKSFCKDKDLKYSYTTLAKYYEL